MNFAAFKDADKVTVNRGIDKKAYMKEGSYLMKLDVFKCHTNAMGIDNMISEYTTVHVFDAPEGSPSHKVGEEVGSVSKQGTHYYVRDIKAVITACTGCSDEEIGEDEIVQGFGFDPETKRELEGGSPITGQYITLKINTVKLDKKDAPGETYLITNIKKAIDPADLLTILSPEVQAKYYTVDGNNVLKEMASAE